MHRIGPLTLLERRAGHDRSHGRRSARAHRSRPRRDVGDRAGPASGDVTIGPGRARGWPAVADGADAGRLLRACGLQARVALEPYLADIDAALDEALAGTAELRADDLHRFASALDAAGVRWAVDGATAVALQGLAVAQEWPCLAVVDDLATRTWLRAVWAKGLNRHGFSLAPHWEESPELVRLYVREPVWTRLGFVQLRFLDDLVPPVQVVLDDLVLPVLPLLEIEQAAPQLADLLARLRQRRAAT